MSVPFFTPKFDLSGRDITCFLFAAGVHSLLLLWQGGALTLPDQPGANLGDMLVQVNFMTQVPNFESPGGGTGERPKSFFAKVKSLLKGEGAENKELAMGKRPAPIEAQKPSWTKTDTLTNKPFVDKKGFQGLAEKDALTIAKGDTRTVLVKPSQGNFKTAQPNLKENVFKLARKDVPFKIASPKNSDELTNVNAIPVVVGRTTTPSVKSLEGGPGAGPALQSKKFASRGSTSGASFGEGKAFSKSAGGSGLLAMGNGASQVAAGSLDSAGQGGGGTASGYGSGDGSGRGSGSGNGVGSGRGGGRTWGGGSGLGANSSMASLPRRLVPSENEPAGAKKVNNSGFSITGTLANRPIMQKAFARYETNCRVALRFHVDWSGKVLDGILVEVSSGNPTFDQKVIASLKEWAFSRLPANRSNEIQEGVITFVFKGV